MIIPSEGTRCEVKFASYNINYSIIMNWLKSNNFNFKKEYNNRTINNLYFDTNNLDAYTKIVPCGIKDKEITNLIKIKKQKYNNISDILIEKFLKEIRN